MVTRWSGKDSIIGREGDFKTVGGGGGQVSNPYKYGEAGQCFGVVLSRMLGGGGAKGFHYPRGLGGT